MPSQETIHEPILSGLATVGFFSFFFLSAALGRRELPTNGREKSGGAGTDQSNVCVRTTMKGNLEVYSWRKYIWRKISGALSGWQFRLDSFKEERPDCGRDWRGDLSYNAQRTAVEQICERSAWGALRIHVLSRAVGVSEKLGGAICGGIAIQALRGCHGRSCQDGQIRPLSTKSTRQTLNIAFLVCRGSSMLDSSKSGKRGTNKEARSHAISTIVLDRAPNKS